MPPFSGRGSEIDWRQNGLISHKPSLQLEKRLQASLAKRDELLLQQAATAEILKVINSSPGNLAPPGPLGPQTGMGRLVRGESFVHIVEALDDEGSQARFNQTMR